MTLPVPPCASPSHGMSVNLWHLVSCSGPPRSGCRDQDICAGGLLGRRPRDTLRAEGKAVGTGRGVSSAPLRVPGDGRSSGLSLHLRGRRSLHTSLPSVGKRPLGTQTQTHMAVGGPQVPPKVVSPSEPAGCVHLRLQFAPLCRSGSGRRPRVHSDTGPWPLTPNSTGESRCPVEEVSPSH